MTDFKLMDRFVLGFIFDRERSKVLLIEKTHPEWQKGKLNGIGGKIEQSESGVVAMQREAFEEAGLNVDWQLKAKMKGMNNNRHWFECLVFYAYDDSVESFEQKEDEKLALLTLDEAKKHKKVASVDMLISLGLCDGHCHFATFDYDFTPEKLTE